MPAEDPWASQGTGFWLDLVPDIVERAKPFCVADPASDLEVRAIFCEHLESQLGRASVACEAHDAIPLRELGHSLQGAGGTVGLAAMSVVGLELSTAARAGDWARCRLIVERLRQWLDVARRG